MEKLADKERLRTLFAEPALRWVLDRIIGRLAVGRPLHGMLVRSNATPDERRAVDDLLGRKSTAGTQLTLDLDTLEHTLRCAGLINTLADVALACHGAVENRRAESDRERSEWQAVFTAARLLCDGRPPLLAWVNAVAGNGTLKRLAQGDREKAAKLLECAFQVLERDSREEVLLATLAAECAGDSHALDRGQPLGTLCLRGIVAAHGVDGQQSADARREAWATVGVVIDDLSAPALVLNLRAAADPILNRFSGFTGSRRSPHSSLIGSFRAVRISSRRILRRASSLSARIPASSARPPANLARGAGR